MNYDNYYKNGGMTKEESISAIALRIGARKDAVAKFVEEHDIDTNKLNSDLKSGKVFFMDVITGIVGKPNNKYQKEIIKKYGSKMAMGGKTQGYDDREDERLGMDYGKISGKDFDGSHAMREHSRRDDARFEKRLARGGKIDEKEKLSNITYQLINTTDSFKKNNPEEYRRMKDEYKAQFIKVYGKDEYAKRHIMADGGMMADGGKMESDFIVGDSYFNSSEGGKYKFVGKDDSGRLIFTDAKGTKRIFSPKKMYKYADGGVIDNDGAEEMKQLWFVTDSRGAVKNISTSVPQAEVFLASALKYDGVINYVKVPLKDWESEKVNVGNIRGYASSFWKNYKKGGEIEEYADGGYIDEDQLHELARLVMDSIDYTVELSLDEFILYVNMTGYQEKLCKYVLKMFDEYDNPKPRLGEVEEFFLVRKGMFEYIKNYYLNEYPDDDLGADINPRADFDGLLMVLNEGDDVYEYLGVTDSLVRERVFQKLADLMGVDYNQIYDMWLSSDEKFAKGGKVSYREAGENYEYVNTFGIEQDDFEQIVDAYHKSPSPNQMDRIESRTTFNKMRNKYGLEKVDEVGNYIHKTHQSHGKMAKGGAISEQNELNKKVLALVQKANVDSKLEFGQLVVSALTDANAHSQVRKFISIMENKPEWAEKPKEIDMKLPREEFEKQREKTVYGSKYYDANEKIDDLGRKIASMFGWDIVDISDALIFASKMSGRNDVAQALEKLDSDEGSEDLSKNKWNYTDVDDIEYVVVKDKNGKELKFAGKYVLSGVHDLLEKGGKLSEKGKYYSKDNVVSVVVGGKNIIDKNTVSGVWIMKDAKPVAEDVVDMKIGKTTIKKGHNGWVGKTMVENFKGYDWDITTIKNYNGDLTTTAQGGKNEKRDGYGMFTFMLYQDPNIRLKVSRPARVTDKVVTEQHEQAVKEFKERADEIAQKVDEIQSKKKMADGGAIGFDALAKKVAKNYEGDKVKKEFQKEYGKTYDKKEAEEVGKKVAAKVYRQQQANKGKMKKGGRTSSYDPSESKMTKIARKASEIRKENESWRDAFNRAKAIIG